MADLHVAPFAGFFSLGFDEEAPQVPSLTHMGEGLSYEWECRAPWAAKGARSPLGGPSS